MADAIGGRKQVINRNIYEKYKNNTYICHLFTLKPQHLYLWHTKIIYHHSHMYFKT